jgi:hypothetical protein
MKSLPPQNDQDLEHCPVDGGSEERLAVAENLSELQESV